MKYCPLNYSESSKKYEILELRTDEYDCDYGPYDLETFFHSVEITKKADGSISGFSFYEPNEETFYFVPFDKKIIYSSNGYRLNQDYYATDEIFVADCFPDVARSLPYSDYFDDIAYFSIPISFEKGVMSPKNGKPLIVICGNAYEFDLQQPYSQLNPQVYKALYSYILENEAVYESDLQWAVIDNPIKARDMLVGEYRYVRTSFPNSIDYTDYVRWARRDYGYEYCLHKLTLENGENYEMDFDAFYYTDDPGFLNIDYPTREILVITKIASLEKTEGHFVNTVYIPSSYK